MKASVLFAPRTPLKVEDLELEPPRAGEVRVRMVASGVCHSCLHAADGSWHNVPMPIVLGAVINTAAVPPGASMAVFGVGGVGLNVVQGGAMIAAQPIIAVDVLGAKLDQARALGATHAIDASKEDPVAEIRRITRRGADFTFVAVGDTRAVGQAADALAPGGTCVVIGVPATGATLPLDVRPLVTGERVIRGSSYGRARTREDLPRLVELYRGGRLKIDELITRRYGLDEANEAFRA